LKCRRDFDVLSGYVKKEINKNSNQNDQKALEIKSYIYILSGKIKKIVLIIIISLNKII